MGRPPRRQTVDEAVRAALAGELRRALAPLTGALGRLADTLRPRQGGLAARRLGGNPETVPALANQGRRRGRPARVAGDVSGTARVTSAATGGPDSVASPATPAPRGGRRDTPRAARPAADSRPRSGEGRQRARPGAPAAEAPRAWIRRKGSEALTELGKAGAAPPFRSGGMDDPDL
jgi:hypothetical protein